MSGRQYSLSHGDDLAQLYTRVHKLETSSTTIPFTARNQVTASDYASITATTPTLAFQYDFPFTSKRITVIVEAYQTGAVGCSIDLYDLNASVVIGTAQSVTATSGTLFTFNTKALTKNATTGMASVAIRASRTSGTFNVRPVWAGNIN